MSLGRDSLFLLGTVKEKADNAINSIKEIKITIRDVEKKAKKDLALHKTTDKNSFKNIYKKIYQWRLMSLLALLICFLVILKSPEALAVFEKLVDFVSKIIKLFI